MYLVLGRKTGQRIFINDITLTVNQITHEKTTLEFSNGTEHFNVTRKAGAKISLSEDINIVVTDINNGQIKLGFDAPKSVTILREEVKLKQEQLAKSL